jgi:hypothetical protein
VSGSTAVVHLIRRVNGVEPFDEFMTSYERHDAGRDHDLVLLFKGFESPDELAPYRRRAAGHKTDEIHISDAGIDVSAYLEAARRLSHRRICVMNSWTTPLSGGWLDALESTLDRPDAGIAGATGSWASHRSAWTSRLGLPNGYGGKLPDLRPMVRAMQTVDIEEPPRLPARLKAAARGVPSAILAHPGFPSPHIRITACAIDRELLLSLRSGRAFSKPASYRLESGHRSWTTQLIQRGLVPYVVGRESGPLPPAEWASADIFWQGAQGDLLAADRKTVSYQRAPESVRAIFAYYAWGKDGRAA